MKFTFKYQFDVKDGLNEQQNCHKYSYKIKAWKQWKQIWYFLYLFFN